MPLEVPRAQSSGEDEGVDGEGDDHGAVDDSGDTARDPAVPANVVRLPELEFSHHTDVVSAADWMCDGMQIVTASWDRLATLADASTGEQVCQLSGHDQEINDVHAHVSQRQVLTASKDTTFRYCIFSKIFVIHF